ncbi:hypothetical protein [Saccharothrix sp. ST-888]|uniref:hypothetical protein n=1 Tax=Saccharothrix sp. ST-888 TaxID=1427391 RepID=UPI000ADFAA06|nr:hypothetical protein [Saccharothrix sp. ST-888]
MNAKTSAPPLARSGQMPVPISSFSTATKPPVAVLRMAVGRGGLGLGCIFHSDSGSEGGLNRSNSKQR